jgi:PAS domain S-box-containing protein
LAEQSAGIGIWDSDPATGLVRGTPQFFRLIGFEPSTEPVPIEVIRSVRHPEDQHRVLDGFRKAVDSGAKIYDSEYRIIRRTDGELRWIFGRGLVSRDASGKPVRYSGIDIDITERKKAEAALRESEERFRSLVQGVRDYAIFMLDGEGQVTTWNDGAALIFGYSAQEILGKPLSIFYPFERADQGWPALEISRARTGGRTEDEGRRLRKDGSRFWANVVISALRDESGRLKGFATITRDLTKAREAEEALRSSEERLRLCQEAAEIGIWDWDIASGEIGWSERNFALHGLRPEPDGPSYGQWQNAIHPADRDRVNAGIAQAIATGAPYQADYRVLHENGEARWLTVRGRVITDEYGRPVRMLGVNLDITDRRSAAEALARLNDELEQRVAERTVAFEQEAAKRAEAEARLRQSQKMEALGQLTGGVAHDFNNLLTVILGSLETMQRRITDVPGDEREDTSKSKLSRSIGMALQATQSAAQLTHRLLAFSRQQPLQPKVLQINELIAGITEMIARTLSEAVQLETHLAPDLWLAFADANQLEIALLNLVVNSRDAMPEGGKLTIETANAQFDQSGLAQDIAAGDFVMLTVSDTGTGMTKEVIDRAFDPFFTTKGPGKGSGLGLSMAYGFVKQSGGHIRLYSELGHGTCVKIYLPRSREMQDETSLESDRARPVSRVLPHARQGETILVVEDNVDVRGYSVSTLLDLGYTVREAGTGPEALRLLQEQPEMRLDLLFTDVVLPDGMNGRQLADRLLKLRPALPILFTTGYTRGAIVKHGRLDPEINLIAKPFNIDQLARKIRQLLDGREA